MRKKGKKGRIGYELKGYECVLGRIRMERKRVRCKNKNSVQRYTRVNVPHE